MLPVWGIVILLLLQCDGLSSDNCGFNSMCTCTPGQHDQGTRTIHGVSCISVPFYKFPNLPEGAINQLEVAGSKTAVLEADILAGCQVQVLVLNNNRLHHIADRTFSSQWKSLTSLDLSYNQLDDVPFSALKDLKNLQWINLHGNQVSTVEGDWSHLRSSVSTLFLGENDIVEIPADLSSKKSHGLRQLKSLIWLNLDGNRIYNLQKLSLPATLQTASLSHNLIDIFPTHILSSLPQLQWLYLRGNHIKTLPDHTFSKRLWIEKIDLAENFLKVLPRSPFNNSVRVRDLNLAHNDFRMLTAESFNGLAMRRIILSYNMLDTLDIRCFSGIDDTLEYIDFDHNNFRHIPQAVSHLKNLKYLYLSSNSLSIIPEDAFDKICSNLKALSLSGNNLMKIPSQALQNCTSISHFNVAFNEIYEIQDGDLSNWVSNIKSLILSNNRIMNLRSHVFAELQNLNELSLSFNPLRVIDKTAFLGLQNLESLELSFSLNSDLSIDEIFSPLINVQWLSIDNNNLKNLPKHLIKRLGQLRYFNVESNDLHFISNDFFHSHTQLKDIRMSYNELKYVETGTFRNMPNLESVSLCGNKIEYIQSGSFANLPNLTGVMLSHNYIHRMSPNAFVNLTSMNHLNLQNNLLSELSFKCFTNVTGPLVLNFTRNLISSCTSDSRILRITVIDLTYNKLVRVPKCLTHTASLKKLFLNHNSITSLDHNAFIHLSSLEILQLNNNNIFSVGRRAFFGLSNIQVLDLSCNNIGQLHTSQFVNMHKLRIVNLKENRLSYLPRDIFSDTLLEMLDLSFNSFAVVPTASISDIGITLRHLSLRSNNIEHVDITTFPDVSSLQFLDLSNNKLTILPDNVFTGLGLLQTLDLSFNPLRSNFKELFHYAQSLKYLDLSGSGITFTPHFPLPNLIHLNLSHNQIESISRHSVGQLVKLKLLDISHNYLESVPTHLWVHLPRLKILNMSNNPLKELTADSFQGLNHLQELTLLNMKYITKFESDSIQQLRILSKLTIETWPRLDHFYDQFCNLLSHLDQLRILKIHFSERKLDEQLLCITNRKIRQLEIRGRNLKTIDRDAFARFTRNPELVLKIHGTQIEDLPAGLFANMYKIGYLKIDLRHNQLSHLSPEIFYGNSSGWSDVGTTLISGGLTISDNPFRCGCHLAWLGHWLRRWLRESVHTHNQPIESALRMTAAVKESTCLDVVTGKKVPIVDLPQEDSSCLASALSNSALSREDSVMLVFLLFLFDFFR
ncbi:unnamed protein product [Phaedon cochleariae]|uniref:Chaoptin n=1 Tax=Phaedon cochleariae TaxID=80249 RepID=A0A9P0DFJ6_PHACE|nr:unnamed protein product [Phaedon cochleariae]